MIVAGVSESVGSNRADLERAIRQMRKAASQETLDVRWYGNDLVTSAQGVKATLWRVDFIKEQITVIRSGENKGKGLASHNIVRSKTRLQCRNVDGAHRCFGSRNRLRYYRPGKADAPSLAAKYCP